MTLLQTSPLLFLRPDGRSNIAGRTLQGRLSLSEIELLSFFAEPKSSDLAIDANFDSELIARAIKQGLLIECDAAGQGQGSLWETYNQQRAAYYMFSSFEEVKDRVSKRDKSNSSGPTFKEHLKLNGAHFAHSFPHLLNRRTERFFTKEAVSLETLTAVASDVNTSIADNSWLSFRVLAQGVEGLTPGVYSYDTKAGAFLQRVDHYSRRELLECLHGQWWLNGGGFCWFFVVSLSELAKGQSSSNSSAQVNIPRSYFEMIVLLGAAGQALVNSAYSHNLGCWMTPALSETQSAKILGLNSDANDNEEALYFFKVGIPERSQIVREEKRSPI